ncbi:MAG: zf-HC2 domain-containing protein [Acidobacteria bacterium]|nr:zf-HC2 domain-containing protein [Acidobacteriota bacterium]
MAPDRHAEDDCRALLLRMARGIEGDLSPAERRALAKHLAGCRRCGEFSKSLQRTIALCREAGAPAMSARARARARAAARGVIKVRGKR